MKLGRRTVFDLKPGEESYFWQAAGISRFAWNWGLGRWNELYEAAKLEPDGEKREVLYPTTEKLKAEWAAVRKIEFPWSFDVTKCAGTQAIIDLGAAFACAFKERREAKAQGRKPRKMFGFPKFKAKNKVKPSYALWSDQIKLCTHHSASGNSYSSVNIPNLGRVKLREWVPSIGAVLGARVTYQRGRWGISIQFDVDRAEGEQSAKAAIIAVAKLRKEAVAQGKTKEEALEAFPYLAPAKVEQLMPKHPKPDTVAGHDLGLISMVVCHTEIVGQPDAVTALSLVVPNPRRLTRTDRQKKLRKKRERKLSKSIHKARVAEATKRKLAKGDTSPVTSKDLKGIRLKLSKRQRRQSNRLSKDTWATTDARGDFLHKLSNDISLGAEVNVLEDLHVHGMMVNKRLAKSLSDAALGRLGTFIEYKTERAGGLVLWAPRFFPSSKRCNECSVVHAKLDLDEREWICNGCGAVNDRDSNASGNLCWLGQLACSEGKLPPEAKPWAKWVHEARETVAAWRTAKSLPRTFETMPEVGAACPDPIKRGECGKRARRNPGSDPHREPRTTQLSLFKEIFGEQTHLCSQSG